MPSKEALDAVMETARAALRRGAAPGKPIPLCRCFADGSSVTLTLTNCRGVCEEAVEHVARAIAAAEARAHNAAIEECKQVALVYRDEADAGKHPDLCDPHHSLGQGFAANMIAKRIGALAAPSPDTDQVREALNKMRESRYNQLREAGKHGHYEAMFRVVQEERARARTVPFDDEALQLEAMDVTTQVAALANAAKAGEAWPIVYQALTRARNAAIEECAQKVETFKDPSFLYLSPSAILTTPLDSLTLAHIAQEIRALATPSPDTPSEPINKPHPCPVTGADLCKFGYCTLQIQRCYILDGYTSPPSPNTPSEGGEG